MTEFSAIRIFETPKDGAYFFGYFATPQISKDGTRLLALRVNRFDRVPEPEDVADVGWFDLKETLEENHKSTFHKIGETSAFNWQQGAMLQFLGPDFNDEVIWNIFDGTEYRAEIHNLKKGESRMVPAIYNPSPEGDVAISVDFERHAWCRRGYSYGNVMKPEKNKSIVPGDALWSVDLKTGERKSIITLDDMLNFQPLSSMQDATHYLEHTTMNPTGTHFVFLHRWRHANGIHSRFLVARADGSEIKILNDSGRMSHFCWIDEHRLLGYGGKANPVNKMRRNRALIKVLFKPLLPIYKTLVSDTSNLAKSLTGDAYYIFDIRKPGELKSVASSLKHEDGHPAILPGGRYFITDTYARAAINQKPRLYLGDLETDLSVLLDELDSIAEYDESPLRCDLHPCVSPCGRYVSIDTMDGGTRRTYAYELECEG